MIQLIASDYKQACSRLKKVTINNLFARSVVEHRVEGKVYVDNVSEPNCYYVVHPYGMSLLYGQLSKDYLSSELTGYLVGTNSLRKTDEFLQIYPLELEERIDDALGERLFHQGLNKDYDQTVHAVVKHKRINFTFNRKKFAEYLSQADLDSYRFLSVDKKLFEQMEGSVVPQKFWNNYSDFARYGVGFSLLSGNIPVAVAFSSFSHDNMLELGMETAVDHRQRGYASRVSAKLIMYCIDNGLEPIWACRAGNLGSYNLAIKMGFEPSAYLPYYELCSPAVHLD